LKLPARALLLAALCALIWPSAAWAHASLVRSEPADSAVVAAAPSSVRFIFSDEVRLGPGIKAIRNGARSVLAAKPRIVNGRVLVVPLRAGLGDGDYTVLWRVLADDGHTLAGVISFGIGVGRAPPTPAFSVDTGPSAEDVVSRLLFFAGLLTAAGAAFFRFAVGPVPVRLLLGAFLLVFVGVSGMLHGVPISTRFGTVMSVAAIVAAAGALLAAVAPLYPILASLPFVLALVLLPAPSLAGHALDSGRPRIEVVVDVFHVAAASLWLGGLVALAFALRAAGDRRTILHRFSNLAVVSVLVLAATGVTRAFAELDSVSQAWSTGYGRVLVVKTALLTLLVAIGWVNRYRLIPRMSLTGLRRNVAASLALFAGLVAAVALLTDLRPGRDRVAAAAVAETRGPPRLPPKSAVVQARQHGELAVALAARRQRADVTVLGPDGQGVDGLRVEIGGVSARSCGAGCYAARVSPSDSTTVDVDGTRFAFRVPLDAPPANALVDRATRAFRALRSVEYVERLASSPRNQVVAHFTLERPNRLEYRIRGGAAGIVIGNRRWDRARGREWEMSPQTPLPQPEPIWAGGLTNAYVLEATPSTYVVSFLNRNGPAWFTVRLDRRTLLPRGLAMTAAAHFMTHRYTKFNASSSIKAPSAGR
jgi:copper transport protein